MWHLILVEDLMLFVHTPDLKKRGQVRGNYVVTNESVILLCQIYKLSAFLQDLGNQADINCEVITVSVICIYFK